MQCLNINFSIAHCTFYAQTHILKTAAESDPNTMWWIKGDGVDVVMGLKESVRGEWSGDADLSDGKLKYLYQKYKHKLQVAASIGLKERYNPEFIKYDLNAVSEDKINDLTFVHQGKPAYHACTL